MKKGIYIVVAFALLMLFVFFYSLSLEYMKTKLIPLGVSAIGFFLAIMEIIKQTYGLKRKPLSGLDLAAPRDAPKGISRQYLFESGWLIFLCLGFYVAGIIIIPLFVLAYLMAHGRKLKISVPLAGLMVIISYSLFYFFKIPIPWGLLQTFFPD